MNGALDLFEETFSPVVRLAMFLVDDDCLKLKEVWRMSVGDFFYFLDYKILKNKIDRQDR